MIYTSVIFVDFENLQVIDKKLLTPKTKVIIFAGSSQSKKAVNVTNDLFETIASVELIKITRGGPNALDFFIAFYLGQFADTIRDSEVIIYSRDKGYDPLIEYLAENGMKISRKKTPEPKKGKQEQNADSPASAAEPEKASPRPKRGRARQAADASGLTKPEPEFTAPARVKAAPEPGKTARDGAANRTRTPKSVPVKKAEVSATEKIYRVEVLEKVTESLRKMPKLRRPRKAEKLQAFIDSTVHNLSDEQIEWVVRMLQDEGIIEVAPDSGKITYKASF